MATAAQLKLVSTRLSLPPFSKTISSIQLHDDYTPPQLLSLITEIMAFLDADNPNSWHKSADIRTEDPEDTVIRLGDFLRVLKFKEAMDTQKLLEGDKTLLLPILCFLLKDTDTHKKRAYLYQFLSQSDLPPELEQDEDIVALTSQVQLLQEQFKETHKYMESIRSSGNTAATLKQEIQQMEEEKQQITSKLTKVKKNVEAFPKRDQWLQTAKNLRLEQQNEINIADRIRDQKGQIALLEKNIQAAHQSLKDAKALFITGGPEAYFAKMEEDTKTNKYLAQENLPLVLKDLQQQSQDLVKIIMEPNLSEKDVLALEDELKATNEVVAQLSEKKLVQNSSGDAKLALFRQQSSIIARKKEGTASKLAELQESLTFLSQDLEAKQNAAKTSSGVKMLRGEEFKRYVSELRGKSTTYKIKKAELSALSTEYGVLQRTEELLKNKEQKLKHKVHKMEKKMDVIGFHEAQEILEKVSEKKTEVDEAKGKTLNEISEIVSQLMNTLNEKKAHLAPVIQELRTVRQEHQDLENDYLERKRIYDATMVGLDSDSIQLEQEVKGYQQDISNDQSRYHHLDMMVKLLDNAQERVLNEMKSYIGGDDHIETIQATRGFKSYRDVYHKKIAEADHLTKSLKETQKEVKNSQDRNLHQLFLFTELKKLMALKAGYNKVLIARSAQTGKTSPQTQDRLVL